MPPWLSEALSSCYPRLIHYYILKKKMLFINEYSLKKGCYRFGQEHVLTWWSELSQEEQEELIKWCSTQIHWINLMCFCCSWRRCCCCCSFTWTLLLDIFDNHLSSSDLSDIDLEEMVEMFRFLRKSFNHQSITIFDLLLIWQFLYVFYE